jgi:hypothetical protein
VSPGNSIGSINIATNTSELTVSSNRNLNITGNWTNNGGSYSAGTGFPYIVANVNILPGKLIYFKGIRTNESNQLRWEYKDAYLLKNIHVERSLNSTDFIQHTQIFPGINQEIFQYTDVQGRNLANAYYRLRFSESDGMVSYSHTILIAGKERTNPVLL